MIKPYYQDKYCTIYHGDCLEIMPELEPVDLVAADLPYGVTASKWDCQIPIDKLWSRYNKVTKNRAIILLTGVQPFSSKLVLSNLQMFKYEWIWIKNRPTGFPASRYKPLTAHEHILVFGKGKAIYNPQKTKGHNPTNSARGKSKHTIYQGDFNRRNYKGKDTTRFPLSFQFFKCERGYHTNQKPVALFRYLIETYSNEGDVILDNTMGSGTTLVAAKQLNRHAIGIEIEEKYCEIAVRRLAQEVMEFK